MTRVFSSLRLVAFFGLGVFLLLVASARGAESDLEKLYREYRIRMVGRDWGEYAPEPAPTPPPSAIPRAVAPPPIEGAYRFQTFTFGLGLNFTDLGFVEKATSANSRLLSDTNYSASGIWHHVWSRRWRTFIATDFGTEKYSLSSNGYSIDKGSTVNFGGSLGVERRLHPRFSLGVLAGYRKETFVALPTAYSLGVESAWVPRFGASARWVLSPAAPIGYSLDVRFERLLSSSTASIQSESGTALSVRFKMEKQRPTDRLGFGLFYTTKSYGSTLMSLSQKLIGFELDIRFTSGQ